MADLDIGSSGVDAVSCATEALRCSRIYGRPDIGPFGRRSDGPSGRASGMIYLPPLPLPEVEKRDKDRPLSPRPCYVYQPCIPITPSGPEIDYFVPMPDSDLRFPPPVSDTAYREYDGETLRCLICNREGNHTFLECPYMILATHHVFKVKPPKTIKHRHYIAVFEDVGYHGYGRANYFAGYHGYGRANYFAPDKDEVQTCAADAMRLHKEDGVNLVRITDLPGEKSEPEQLCKVFKQFGRVTHVITFHDQGLGFVGFVSENAAKTAARKLNSSGYGHVTLSTESLQV